MKSSLFRKRHRLDEWFEYIVHSDSVEQESVLSFPFQASLFGDAFTVLSRRVEARVQALSNFSRGQTT